MILNVSGRTDVVAFYSKWFMNCYHNGFIDVRNPFNKKMVSRIYFKDVDAIVFCTKNPLPILKYLKEIKKPIIFHITLTPYKKDIEPNVLPKGIIIEAIKKVSEIVGIENVYVRYDPIFLSDKYNIEYHIKAFDKMCTMLSGSVKKIIVSFIDNDKNVSNNSKILKLKEFTLDDYKKIGLNFSKSASKNKMTVQTCFEEKKLIEYGFINEVCVSPTCIFKLTGKTNFKTWKARKCGCVEMVDIGEYNTCKHFCKYCYANYDESKVEYNFKNHNPNSSIIVGNINEDDVIKVRI